MYELYQNSQKYSHTLTGHFPLQAEDTNVCRLMVRTFLAVFCISPKGDPGKLHRIYLT